MASIDLEARWSRRRHLVGDLACETCLSHYWSKVEKGPDPDACWGWAGATVNGYGKLGWHGRTITAHRISWSAHYGPIPEGLQVLHTCDNPPCSNPLHLFLGTNADNMADRVAKGRSATGDRNGARTHPERRPRGDHHRARTDPSYLARGERSGLAKLTNDEVRSIRRQYEAGGISQHRLAASFGVTAMTINSIVRRISWTHI